MLAFACAFTMFAGAASYSDKADIKATTAVDMLSSLGVIQGYDDGSFKPNTTVTRAQMAKMIFTIMNGGNDNANAYASLPTKFTDLPTAAWAQGYVRYLQNTGIIAGKSVTKFAPNDTVTGLEAAKMVLVAAGYNAQKAGLTGAAWAQNTMKYGQLNNLFEDVDTDLNAALPRQYAAQILYNALDMERVVWSNDIEDFKPATDVKDDKTIGGKYMDLVKTDAAQLTKVKKTSGKDTYEIKLLTDEKDKNGKYIVDEYTKVPTDVSDLIGLKVKVLVKEKSNGTTDVYGVYADDDSKVIATGTVGQLEDVTSSKKTKLNGTEYKLDSEPENLNVIEPNTNTSVKLSTLEAATAIDKVAGTVKLVDTNGNNKADTVVYIPAKVGKITYAGSKSITISNGTGSNDVDDYDIYEGYAKDDWTVVTDKTYTASDDIAVAKVDVTSAKVTSVKSSTPVEVKVNDTWYKVATGSVTDDTSKIKAGNTYDLAIVGNYVVNAKETEASSDDILVVTDYETNTNGMAGSTTQKVKAYFLDGSSKTITVEKLAKSGKVDETDVKFQGNCIDNSGVNKLYSYTVRSNGNYSLKLLDGDNKAGYETAVNGKTGTGLVADDKVDSKNINDNAVVFAMYMDQGKVDSKTNIYDNVKILTGKTVNDWNSAYGTTASYVTKKVNGVETVRVLVVAADSKYAGAGSDYKYAYLTADPYDDKSGEDNDESTIFEAWTGSESVVLKTDGKVGHNNMVAGSLLVYTNDGDKFINVENGSDLTIYKAAVTGNDEKAKGNIVFQGFQVDVNGNAIKSGDVKAAGATYTLDEDCVFIAVNDDKQEAMEGASVTNLKTAEEVDGAKDTYYANAYVVVENDHKDYHVLAVIYDADNQHLNGDVKIDKNGAIVK